ncbi:MAG: UTP--glucose-1-phosphate uridylyltransferase [Propionibacteriaceae bacterium]|nr:UTP--glucose-1-phosphate uridylyltransferase [Propionibacteriaceae bacterium]
MSELGLNQSIAKMRGAGVDAAAIAVFTNFYQQLESGETGLISEDSISGVYDLPKLSEVSPSDAAIAQGLAQTVMIKLNGGLGTSMGLAKAKTLLQVRDGLNFLDLIVRQVQYARQEYQVRLPLLFMNSFRTSEDTLSYLERYPDLEVAGLGLDFIQNQEPKLLAQTLTPVSWPTAPELEWCPPGHGDVYPALWGSGMLEKLLDAGFRYANIANGDNLGAAPDPKLAGWFAASGAPYAAEVCLRTVNDRKGGHLAYRNSDGQLILRDTAQTPDSDLSYFTDEERHPYFNCNTLWIDLEILNAEMQAHGGDLGLPLIRNEKTVDPADSQTPKVIQIESAMGAAIEVFSGAKAIVVERDRFLPVKTTNELLLLRSDLFTLGADYRLSAQSHLPEVSLDPRFYRLVTDFEERFSVIPSLLGAERLEVQGDWSFDTPSSVVGSVVLKDSGQPCVYR